jgi:sentrin-specific protease 7
VTNLVSITNFHHRYHWYLAIICNVSKIERKPMLENFDEDLSKTHGTSRDGSVTLVTTNETEDMTAPPLNSSPKPSVGTQDTLNEHSGDDVYLFEEDPLSLVDPEETGAKVHLEPKTNQERSVTQSPQAESVDVAHATANAKRVLPSIFSHTPISPTKIEVRRKPAQPKRDPNQPVILILDSLSGGARSGTVRALKDWLTAEGEAKRGMKVEIREKGYYPKASQIPMQGNYTDCGVYLLGYVEKFFQNPDGFKNKLLTGSMSAEEDWPELKPEDMRTKMREIILDLHDQQEQERKSKKVKKRVTKSRSPPAAPTQGHTQPGTKAPLTERVAPQEAAIWQEQHEETQHIAAEQPNQPRLASPFEFDKKQPGPDSHSVSNVVGKVSDSPPGATSPIKPAQVTSHPGRTPIRNNPKVHIPAKTPQSNASARYEQVMSAGIARQPNELGRMGHARRSLSPTKRRRLNADEVGLPAAKKQSPQQKERDRSPGSSPLNPRSREGSAPGMPIEIEDSQEANPTVSRYFQQPRTEPSAQRKPPSPKPSLRHSPSIEEIECPSPVPKRKQRQSEASFPGHALGKELDVQDYARDQSRRSKAPAPPSSLNRTDEAEPDSAEEISQSTGRMQLDGADDYYDDAVVRETPEPGRRSPNMQGG